MAELQTKVFKIRIRGSVDDVWREITKTNEVQGVMFNMKLDSTLKVGERALPEPGREVYRHRW